MKVKVEAVSSYCHALVFLVSLIFDRVIGLFLVLILRQPCLTISHWEQVLSTVLTKLGKLLDSSEFVNQRHKNNYRISVRENLVLLAKL